MLSGLQETRGDLIKKFDSEKCDECLERSSKVPWQSFQLGQSEKASCRRWHSHCSLSEDGKTLSRDSKDKSRFSVHPRGACGL